MIAAEIGCIIPQNRSSDVVIFTVRREDVHVLYDTIRVRFDGELVWF
jgi:hypothetical protein